MQSANQDSDMLVSKLTYSGIDNSQNEIELKM